MVTGEGRGWRLFRVDGLFCALLFNPSLLLRRISINSEDNSKGQYLWTGTGTGAEAETEAEAGAGLGGCQKWTSRDLFNGVLLFLLVPFRAAQLFTGRGLIGMVEEEGRPATNRIRDNRRRSVFGESASINQFICQLILGICRQ